MSDNKKNPAVEVIFGIIILIFGYWIGFIGYTQEVGLIYEQTVIRPLGGIVAILIGLSMIIHGLSSFNSQKGQDIRPSKKWYIAPILFGILGGIVGYFIIKDKDAKLAKNLLVVGLIFTFINIALMAI